MLDPASWLDKAKALDVGQRKLTTHDCGSGRKLIVENKPNGWSAWCYRCSDKGWVAKPKPSLKERIAALAPAKAADEVAATTILPPQPVVFDVGAWPDEAKVWLYRAGLDNDWIESLGFYWCPTLKRVVIPVLNDNGELVFWQARGFDRERTKYLSPAIPAGGKPVYKVAGPNPWAGHRDTLVLTEDILSAIRVGKVQQAWSILGTALTDKMINELLALRPSHILVWLDPDEAGVKGRRRIVRQLRSLGLNAQGVRADLDPKCYSTDEIRSKLCIT